MLMKLPYGKMTARARQTVDELFEKRITCENMAAKMDDIWPIENIWGIIVEKLSQHNIKTMRGLKTTLRRIWRNIDKDTCRRLVCSTPLRLQELVRKNGNRLQKFNSSCLHVELNQ